MAHERADGHFQLVRVATLFHEDHEHGTQEARTALVHAVTLLRAPSPGANRSASSSRASSQRSGRCWGKTAAAPRWRTSAENCANRVPFIPSRCSGHRGHKHELIWESLPAEPWMACLVRSPRRTFQAR